MRLNKDLQTFIFSLTFFTFIWAFYNSAIRPKDLNAEIFMDKCVVNINEKIKPAFPAINHNNELLFEKCLDGWSLGHFILYLVTGVLSPGHYKLVFGVSIFCEIFEKYSKQRARISDLYINMIGYIIGSLMSTKFKINIPMKNEYVKYCVLIIIISGIYLIRSRKEALKNTK